MKCYIIRIQISRARVSKFQSGVSTFGCCGLLRPARSELDKVYVTDGSNSAPNNNFNILNRLASKDGIKHNRCIIHCSHTHYYICNLGISYNAHSVLLCGISSANAEMMPSR